MSSTSSAQRTDTQALDELTGGAFSAPTAGERAARVRAWLQREPSAEQMQQVYRELSVKDKGAARLLRERLDELKRQRDQEGMAAEWAQKGQVLLDAPRLNEQNIFRQIERYRPLGEYLSGKVGRNVELTVLPRYGNIVENFRSLGLDGAFFGSFTYALADRKMGVEVIARPVGTDNTSTYYGVIFSRKDSGIRSAAQMKGRRFVFVDKATTAGYLLPLEYFRENRIADYRRFFRETWFA